MLQWFIRFPEFAEFSEFLFYLGKNPMSYLKDEENVNNFLECLHIRKHLSKIGNYWKLILNKNVYQ